MASFQSKTAAEATIVLTLILERPRFFFTCVPPLRAVLIPVCKVGLPIAGPRGLNPAAQTA